MKKLSNGTYGKQANIVVNSNLKSTNHRNWADSTLS